MKKTILFFTLVCLYALKCYADCSNSGLYVFPYGNTIKQNSIIIIDGYASSQTIIKELNKNYSIYLQSGNKKVRLHVKEICVGQFHLTQAVLVPETKLEAGLEYQLMLDNLVKPSPIICYNYSTKKYQPVVYKVIDGEDNETPIMLEKPREVGKELQYYGCGPSIHVIFNLLSKDDSEVMVKATVKPLYSKTSVTYYLRIQDNKIQIGHGMCSGAFRFDEGLNYEVEFSLIDASGNITSWEGKALNFTKPENESEFKLD